MKVVSFDFTFKYKRKTVKASCDRFKVAGFHRYPQYRVVIDKHKVKSEVYNFYKVSNKSPKFFWFKLPGSKEEYAKAIASGLENMS